MSKILAGFGVNREVVACTTSLIREKVFFPSWKTGLSGFALDLFRQLSELGDEVHIVATIAADDEGCLLRQLLEKEVSAPVELVQCREQTPFAVVVAGETESRTLSFKSGYASFPTENLARLVREGQFDAVALGGCISEEAPLIQAVFEAARETEALTVLNPRDEMCEECEALRSLLPLTNLLVVNEPEFHAWRRSWRKRGLEAESEAEEILLLHRNSGPSIVIVTKGGSGAYVSSAAGYCFTVPAYETGLPENGQVGAGDAFLSAFLHAHLRRQSLDDSAAFASVVAGVKVTKSGGGNVVTAKELLTYLPDQRKVRAEIGRRR